MGNFIKKILNTILSNNSNMHSNKGIKLENFDNEIKIIENNGDLYSFEIEMGEEETSSSVEKIKNKPQSLAKIDYRKLQYQISKKNSFYEIAKLLEDYTDETYLRNYEPWTVYYSQYSYMNIAQLKSYIIWRTKVRKNIVDSIDASYVFVYIYELLHLVGEKDEYSTLEKILFIWENVRSFEPIIDKYLKNWIPDFIIYYSIELEKINNQFYKEMKEKDIFKKTTDDAKFLLEAINLKDSEMVNNIICKYGYNFKKGAFSKKDKNKIMDKIVNHLTLEMLDKQSNIMKNLVYMRKEYENLFSGAVFEMKLKNHNESRIVPELNIPLILEYSREIEIKLDTQFGITKRLKIKPKKYLKRHELDFMRRTIKDYIRENNLSLEPNKDIELVSKDNTLSYEENKRIVTIDIKKLKKIRDESDTAAAKLAPENGYDEEISIKDEKVDYREEVEACEDEWIEFKSKLNEHGLNILSLIVDEKDYNEILDYAVSNSLMIEEEIEKINEIAIDILNDRIIDSEFKQIFIIDFYKEDVFKIFKKIKV